MTVTSRPVTPDRGRKRFSDEDIARLLAVAWWDWPAEHITAHIRTIMSGSAADLEAAAPA